MGNQESSFRDPRDTAAVVQAIGLEAMQARAEHARRLAGYATERAVLADVNHPEWFAWRGVVR